LLAIEGTDLRQVREQRDRKGRAHTGNALEKHVAFAPDWRGFDEPFELIVDALEPLFEERDVRVDVLDDARTRHRKPDFLRRDHLHELPATRDIVLQGLGLLLFCSPRLRLHRFAEASEDARVDRIRLRENADRSGEVTDLSRVDDGHRDGQAGQCRRNGDLETAGRLHDDKLRLSLGEEFFELADSFLVVCKTLRFIGEPEGDVKVRFGHVDPDVKRRRQRRHELKTSADCPTL